MARAINTLIKALTILETIVANQDAGLTLTEIVARTATPKSSTHRILSNLLSCGYLDLDKETGKFRGALKLSALGSEVLARFDLRVHMRPHLVELHRTTEHTCSLAIRNGDAGVYIDRIESQLYGIRLFSNVGQTFPLQGGGLGKALLAYADPQDREEIIKHPIEPFTPNTITDPDKLRQELDQVRERGYSIERDEIIRGVMCIGAAILGSEGECVGAISVTFPSYVEKERDLESDIKAIKRCAAAGSAVPHPKI
jgi:IclR family transcriptional regulator, KDG regulon repressor